MATPRGPPAPASADFATALKDKSGNKKMTIFAPNDDVRRRGGRASGV